MIISPELFRILVISWIAIAIIIFPILLKVKAPYGRHTTKKWGALIDNRFGWFIMELPTLILFLGLFIAGRGLTAGVIWILPAAWTIHYVNRIFIFPFRTRTTGKKIPMLIVIMASLFNLVNGFINGYYLGFLSKEYDLSWISDPRFITGAILFISGFIINQASDQYLISLRKGGKKGYFIPQHRFFKYISCPNFAGEIVEWSGFAIMAWNLPAISFALWTAANLIPRAIHHHKWYHTRFPDYPSKRKAIIPWVI